MTIENYTVRELMVPVFIDGKLVYSSPTLKEIQTYCEQEMDTFWAQYKRISNPHIYKVDLSTKLYRLRDSMLRRGEQNPMPVPEMQP